MLDLAEDNLAIILNFTHTHTEITLKYSQPLGNGSDGWMDGGWEGDRNRLGRGMRAYLLGQVVVRQVDDGDGGGGVAARWGQI